MRLMKKKFLYIAALASLMLTTSCDMDLAPIGSLDDETAMQTVTDATSFRNYFYVVARSVTTSQFFTFADIQCDMFNGIVMNGNRMGTIANGTISSGDSDITGYWGTMFAAIANINYFLEYAEPLLAKYEEENNETAVAKFKRFIGEAHFFRAYYYSLLFDRWCVVYSSDKGDIEGLGLPLVTKYDPTSDRSAYPGRSTMNETIEFINNDLALAGTALLEYEAAPYDEADYQDTENLNPLQPNACYVSSYTVKALQARLNLWIGNYTAAKNYAEEVINCGIFKLTSVSAYANLWTKDTGNEVIFMPYETNQELGNAIGSAWLSTEDSKADYIPTSTIIDEYKAAGYNKLTGWSDVRYSSFIGERELKWEGDTIFSPTFTKFPGNVSLQVSGVNLMNKAKAFRLSEMYLIVAESAAAMGNTADANSALNTYMKARIRSYTDQNLTGNTLVQEIRKQRGLELVGEGFRLSDLRRWKQGFTRSTGAAYDTEAYPTINGLLTAAGLEVVYADDDYRYTWPIPSDEITSNPQMSGQQNPGY